MNQMNRKRARASALAVTLCVGAAQVATAQMAGGAQHDSMNWGNTNQYGVPQFLIVLIGAAVLVLLVMLIVKTSKK